METTRKNSRFWGMEKNFLFCEKRRIFFADLACDVFPNTPDISCDNLNNQQKKLEETVAVTTETHQQCDALKKECSAPKNWNEAQKKFLAIHPRKKENPEFVEAYQENIAILDTKIAAKKRAILNEYNANHSEKINIFEELIPKLPHEKKLQAMKEILEESVFYAQKNGEMDGEKIQKLCDMVLSNAKYNPSLSSSLPFMKAYSAFFCENPSAQTAENDKKNVEEFGKKKAFHVPLYEEKPDENGNKVIFANEKNLAGILENIEQNTVVRLEKGTYAGPMICFAPNVQIVPAENVRQEEVIFSGSGKGAALHLAGENSKISNVSFRTPEMETALRLQGKNCVAENCAFSGIKTGILGTGENVKISNCTFSDCSKDGIIFCGDGTTVENNTFQNYVGTDAGHNDWIQMFKGENPEQPFEKRMEWKGVLSRVKIVNNNLDGNGKDTLQGITCFQAQLHNSVISGNQIDVGSVHGITLVGNNNQILNNVLFDEKSGINILGERNTILGNVYQKKGEKNPELPKPISINTRYDFRNVDFPPELQHLTDAKKGL